MKSVRTFSILGILALGTPACTPTAPTWRPCEDGCPLEESPKRDDKLGPVKWTLETSVTPSGLTGIWGADANNIWAVGLNGTIIHWNGTTWRLQTSGTNERLDSVWGSDARNIWAVGGNGTILKWDGTTWSAQVSGTSSGLWSVWGTDSKNIWAVGAAGTIVNGDYEPSTRTYTDLRMEMSCQLPARPS